MNKTQIHIKQLRLSAHIGIHAWEKQWPQLVYADSILTLQTAALNDDIANACDYTVIAAYMQVVCKKTHYNLLETLTTTLAQDLLTEFSFSTVQLTLFKQGALPNSQGIGISTTLEKTTLP